VVLVVKALRAATLVMETINTEALAAEETALREQTAVAQLQTVALAVRILTLLTPAAAVVALLAVLPELAAQAVAVLAVPVQR
jgi:hypothetical protein